MNFLKKPETSPKEDMKKGDFSDMKNDMTSSSIIYALMKLIAFHNLDGYYFRDLQLIDFR